MGKLWVHWLEIGSEDNKRRCTYRRKEMV